MQSNDLYEYNRMRALRLADEWYGQTNKMTERRVAALRLG
jgi:hypothetical protein